MAVWNGTINVNRQERSFSRSLCGISYAFDANNMWLNRLHCSHGSYDAGMADSCDENGYVNKPGFNSLVKGWSWPALPPRHGVENRVYEMRGRGDGEVHLTARGDGYSWVLDAANSVGVVASVGTYKWKVKAQNTNSPRSANPPWKLRVTRTDHQAWPTPYYGTAVHVTNSDYDNIGAYIKEVSLVAANEIDQYIAGNYFRRAWKDNIIHDNHAQLRCQAWNGVLDFTCHGKYRDRTKPGSDNTFGFNSAEYLPYPAAVKNTTGWCKYTVAAVAGTPANMSYGERVYCAVPEDWSTENGTLSSGGFKVGVESVSNAVNAVFLLKEDRTFHVGDKLQALGFFPNSGMTEINDRFFTITAINSPREFVTDLNTSTYSLYRHRPAGPYYNPATDNPPSDGAKDATVGVPIFLKVGSGGTREGPDGKGYPVVGMQGYYPVSNYPGLFGGTGNKRFFQFDNMIGGWRDAAGVVQWGAWRCEANLGIGVDGNGYPSTATVPIEYQVQMINELMDRIDETGQKRSKGPINLHICLPVFGASSLAPGVAPEDLFGVGVVNTVLNGSNGFRPLDRRCTCTIEWTNEPFNFTNPVYQGGYSLFTSAWRWGSNDWTNGAMLHTYRHFWDIEQAFPDNIIPKKKDYVHTAGKRIFFVVPTWPFGLNGVAGGAYGGGDTQIFGTPETTAFMNNALGQKPPGGPATPYAYPQDKISGENIHWVSPGGYLIPTTNGEEGGASWDALHLQPTAAAWVTAGDVHQIASVAVNGSDPYMTDVLLTTPHTWPVGARATFTDIAQTPPVLDQFGDNVHMLNYAPVRVMAVNPTTGAITVDFDIGTAPAFTSGKMMLVSTPAQQAATAEYSLFMELTPGPRDNYNLVSWTELLRDRMLPAMNAQLPELRIMIYEAWIQIQTGIGIAVTGCTMSQSKAFFRDVIMCDAMAGYMKTFLEHSRRVDIPKTDMMSVLTQMLWNGAQWGMQPISPYTFSPDYTVEWGGKGKINEALATFNNVGIYYDATGTVPGIKRTIHWVPA